MLVDGLHVQVAVALEVAPEAVDVQGLALCQQQAGGGYVIGGRQPVHQRGDRHYQDPGSHPAQPVQGTQSLGNNVLVRREIVIGQGLPVGKCQDLDIIVQEERQLPFQRQGRAGVCGDHQQQLPGASQLGNTTRLTTSPEGAKGGAGGLLPWPGCVFQQFGKHRPWINGCGVSARRSGGGLL